MCYMAGRAPHTAESDAPRAAQGRLPESRVRVRELRQNLSVYLARVIAGETLEVTSRGRPVAVLAPLPEPATLAGRLVASGRATPASRRPRDLLPVSGLPSSALAPRLQRALQDLRADKV